MKLNILRTFKHIISHKYFPIFFLLGINLAIGAFFVTDYGESWDEHLRYRYAENSINAYKGIPGDVKDEKGPFFVMIATVGGNLICSFLENCLISDARHYVNFLSFLLGLFFLYRLNLRFTNKWAAFGGTLIFNTQPILWGHAFINPKDIPFMAFFIASIDTGLAMVDSFHYTGHAHKSGLSKKSELTFITQITREWKLITGYRRRLLLLITITILIFVIGLFISQDLVRNGIENIIETVYTKETHSLLEMIFTQLAQNANDIPVEFYIHKAWLLYSRFVNILSLSLAIIWMFLIIINFPKTRNYIWNEKIRDSNKRNWINTIVAGTFLGMSCSIRTLGPAAGGLICLYLLTKHKKKALPMLITYCLLGGIVTYASWPGLWGSPANNFQGSLSMASDFPWDGKVLFDGKYYTADTIPRSYLPVLLTIQLTLTTLITMLYGFIQSVARIIKNKLNWQKVTILYLWFFVPVVLVMIIQPKIYDNFRHFLFVIPPLFTFAAIGLQSVFDQIKRPAFQAILIILLISPNLFSLVKLHPYQYVFYNFLTNGVEGAFREYEMDYWGISYREATGYINHIAPQNSKIIVYGAPHLVEIYARADLEIGRYKKDMPINRDTPTFAILSSRYDKDILLFPEAEIMYSVEREDAIFAVVKDLTNNDPSSQ